MRFMSKHLGKLLLCKQLTFGLYFATAIEGKSGKLFLFCFVFDILRKTNFSSPFFAVITCGFDEKRPSLSLSRFFQPLKPLCLEVLFCRFFTEFSLTSAGPIYSSWKLNVFVIHWQCVRRVAWHWNILRGRLMNFNWKFIYTGKKVSQLRNLLFFSCS